jgi:hypothetical protein
MKTLSKFIFFCCLLFLLRLSAQEAEVKDYENFDDFLIEQKERVDQITHGMNFEQVKEVMGPDVRVRVPKKGRMKALDYVFKQPQFTNEFHKNTEDRRTILWYFYEPQDQNGTISKRECNPIIFNRDVVIGIGWEDFRKFRMNGMN